MASNEMANDPTIVHARHLRLESKRLISRFVRVQGELLPQADASVLLRTTTNRLKKRASNLRYRQCYCENKNYMQYVYWGELADGEICEEPSLLARLNDLACECDKCERAGVISAVIRFEPMGRTLALCGDCFRSLGDLSLGQVV